MHFSTLILALSGSLSLVSGGAVDQYNLYTERGCKGPMVGPENINIYNGFKGCKLFHRSLSILSAHVTYEGLGPVFFYSDDECGEYVGESYFTETNDEGKIICASVPENSTETILSYRLSDCQYDTTHSPPGDYGGYPCHPTRGEKRGAPRRRFAWRSSN